eukprot:scaffold44687_cov51-Phaeocystis_antarctica.AAC.3
MCTCCARAVHACCAQAVLHAVCMLCVGIFDGHAYSVLTCLDNVAGTDIDLVKMRNPHGQGEITNGEFDDDGPGWTRYPQVVVIEGGGGADGGGK